MKKKYRRLFHHHDIHDYCEIVQERVVTGYDHSRKFLAGPWEERTLPDGTVERRREMIDCSSMFGDPIYSGETREVHNP